MFERIQALVPVENGSTGDEAGTEDCPCMLARRLSANSREIVKLFAILTVSLSVAHLGVMLVLSYLGMEHGPTAIIVGGLLLATAMLPIVYFSVVRRLAAKNKALIQREQQLCHIRKELEERVAQRTAELKHSMERLQAHQNEITVLGEMTRLLQASHSLTEAAAIARLEMLRLLPGLAGSLYLLNASRNLLERTVVWGGRVPDNELFTPADCWALRRGKTHVSGTESGIACAHLQDRGAKWHVCIPLAADSDAIGVLCLEAAGDMSAQAAERSFGSPERLQFYETVAEALSMALSNIRLCEKLQHQALRDPLTGLYNRRYMLDALERELLLARRNRHPLSVIMLDIDRFKTFNDTFGHDAGDTVIAAAAEVMAGSVRQSDFVCRYGGEEFMVVLPQAGLAAAESIAEKIRRGIENLTVSHQGQSVGRVTISAGVAGYPDINAGHEALVEAADKALYRSKHNGRNCVTLAGAAKTAAPEDARLPLSA